MGTVLLIVLKFSGKILNNKKCASIQKPDFDWEKLFPLVIRPGTVGSRSGSGFYDSHFPGSGLGSDKKNEQDAQTGDIRF